MINAIENEFQIQLDLSDLDMEQITILRPLSRYVAERGYLKVFLIRRKQGVKLFISSGLCWARNRNEYPIEVLQLRSPLF
jgi:hypothetical protein